MAMITPVGSVSPQIGGDNDFILTSPWPTYHCDPMLRLVAEFQGLIADGFTVSYVARLWGVNAGLIANLQRNIEAGTLRWSQILVDARFPEEGWHLETRVRCLGDATKPPEVPYRVSGKRLYHKECPITGQVFSTPWKNQVYHPATTSAQQRAYRRMKQAHE